MKIIQNKYRIFLSAIVLLIECRGLADGLWFQECAEPYTLHTFVASRSDCSRYIFCDDGDSFQGECIGDNVFNEYAGFCDDPKNVKCNLNVDDNNTSVGSTAVSKPIRPTTTTTTVRPSIPLVTGVHVVHNFGEGVVVATPSTVPNSNSYQLSISNVDVANILLNGIASEGSSLEEEVPKCPPSRNGRLRLSYVASPTSCTSYYTCYNGVAIHMTCQQNMHFDARSGKCQRQELLKCEKAPPVTLSCRPGVNAFIPHLTNCEYYYFCANGALMIFQCPFKTTWHYEKRTCVKGNLSKCISSAIFKKDS